MKKIIIAFSCMLSTFFAQSQINMVRYNDDFSYLKNDTAHKNLFEKLKKMYDFESIDMSSLANKLKKTNF